MAGRPVVVALFSDLEMDAIDYREQFKNNAEMYDRIVQSRHIKLIQTLEKDVLESLFADIGTDHMSVMDFACGSGRWTQMLETHFSSVTGVDVSASMVELAHQKCQKAKFVITDLTGPDIAPELRGREFDVITAFRFYKNAQQELRQAATEALPQYIKPGGLFIFDLHLNTYSVMGLLAHVVRLFGGQRWLGIGALTIRTISLGEIRRLFKNSVFEIVDYFGMGLLPGRSNLIESFFSRHKILRGVSYNILVIARRKVS